jgi:hypothetical protein
VNLAILAAVVACISWTVTQEEVFREPRDHCKRLSITCRLLAHRKFFYLFTCEYCFSHYVAALVTLISGYRLLSADGFGAVVAWLSLVWLANIYMSLFRLLRLAIKALGNKAKILEANAKLAEYQLPPHLKEKNNVV